MEPEEKQTMDISDHNTQLIAGLVFVGLGLFGINRKLKVIKTAMVEMVDAMAITNYNVGLLHTSSTTVKDVVKLAAANGSVTAT